MAQPPTSQELFQEADQLTNGFPVGFLRILATSVPGDADVCSAGIFGESIVVIFQLVLSFVSTLCH